MRRLAGRLGMPALSLLLAVGGATGVPASANERGSSRVSGDLDLDEPARGARAVRLLGDDVGSVAARNDMSAEDLTGLLTSDPSAWLDTTGAIFFKEAEAPATADGPVVAEAPLDQTFLLHSKPGSTRTIFLDFDGGTASGTAWHDSYADLPDIQPAWDPSGNGSTFTDAELTSVQTIWQAVAEDYAPFDVDVTTADPGPAGIHRSGLYDPSYGSHVMITPSTGVQSAICPAGCGGVAYVGVFDLVDGGGNGAGRDGYGYFQPAWVFPHRLGNSPKNIAEAASHEVGHNFGLHHDGNASLPYDRGHGAWAPIMGAGYDHPLSQWSKGDYTDATNQEDDVAIIRAVAGERVDEAPTSIAAAPTVPAGTAYVTNRDDVDTYLLGECSGAVTVSASTLPSQANLDVELTLRDALGHVVATADPPSTQTSTTTASGLGASLTRTLAAGTYYVSVDGVGSGSWSTGYDDYGSMGAYTLASTGCTTSSLVPTVTDLVASATGRAVTLTASPTTTLGSLVGEVVFHEGATVVGRTNLLAPTVTLTSVTPGTHTYTATFVPLGLTHLASTSPPRSVTVQVGSTTALSAAISGRDVTLDVQVATDGGAAAGAVEIRDADVLVGIAPLVAGAASLTLASVSPGDHAYRATFTPSDPASYVGSSSPVRVLTVAADPVPTPTSTPTPPGPITTTAPLPVGTVATVSASSTALRAPRKARAGSRPTVTVTVTRGGAAAAGTVVVTVGTRSRTLTLRSGTVKLRLPRLRGLKVTVRARYLGDPTTSPSSAKRRIRVVG